MVTTRRRWRVATHAAVKYKNMCLLELSYGEKVYTRNEEIIHASIEKKKKKKKNLVEL